MAKIKLVENIILNVKKENIVAANELNKLVEAIDGKPYNCRGLVRNIGISKFTENLNNRVYNRALWENVKKSGVAEGTIGLLDHPENDGSVKDVACVWKNLQLHEDIVTADCYLVGSKGQDIFEAIQAGAKQIGISSVGYGELDESDGKTVNPDSYELTRVGDLVLNPSQGTFMSYENIYTESTQTKDQTKIIENKITNKKENDILEEQINKRENIMLDKVQEANLKNQVRVALKEAASKQDFKEAIIDLKEIKAIVPEELSDTHIKIDTMIESIQSKMEQEIADSKKLVESKELSLKEMTEKYEEAVKALDELKGKYKKLEAIFEKTSDKDIKILIENTENMKSDIEVYQEKTEQMLNDIDCFKEDRKAMLSDIKLALKEKIALVKQIKKLKQESMIKNKDISSYSKQIKEAYKHIKQMEKVLEEEYGYEFDSETDVDYQDDMFPYEDTLADTFEDDTYDDLDVIEDEEVIDGYDSDLSGDMGMFEAEEDDEEKEDEEELEEAEDEDDDEEDEKEMKESFKSKKSKMSLKESKQKFEERRKVLTQIRDYYIDAVKVRPALKDIKDSLFKSGSLYEAVQKVKKFEEAKNNDSMSVETFSKFNKPKDYVFKRD